ncbi:MAG: AAA family ATPase [Nitrosopumilales archaeon]|nr:AAA family ATPase [Nitrosopumilales archaeon]
MVYWGRICMSSQLNQSQTQALTNRLYTEIPVAGVWGPPGTGKTFVAATEATRAVTELDQRILVCAFQNSTVDQTLRYIVEMLKSRYGWSQDIVRRSIKRIGSIAKVAGDLIPHFSTNRNELTTARIVGTTLHSSYVPTGHRVLQQLSFDRIIMDESGQVTPEQAWIPLPLLGNADTARVTAYGDDIQLSPISPDLTPEKGVLRYMRTMNNTSVDMLNTTYRLNWPGIEMTSNVFYFGALRVPQEVRDRRLVLDEDTRNEPMSKAIRPENTLVYVGVSGREVEEGLSYDNHQQAMVIADLCSEFLRHGVDPSRISVIAAYRPHVRTINNVLDGTGIGCTTVHKMLGAENDIIILATTRSNSSRDLGFMTQPELLNVATSRQLMKLIIVGDAAETFAGGCRTSGRIYDFVASHGSLLAIN